MTRESAITVNASKSRKSSKPSLRSLLRFGLISLGGVFVLGYGRSTLADLPDYLPPDPPAENAGDVSNAGDANITGDATNPGDGCDACGGDTADGSDAAVETEQTLVDTFQTDLAAYGRWIDIPGYGRCWQPLRVAADWRPYTVGYWACTDYGLTWQSEEPWGLSTYHYGRWICRPVIGWCWVPGDVWAPAWVSWRSGGGCVGWAPLAPDYRVGVEASLFEADYSSYTFVRDTDVCARRLYTCVLPYERNSTYVRNTTNITNISVVNTTVVNRSIDVARFERERDVRFERVETRTVSTVAEAQSLRSRGITPVYQPQRLRSTTVEHVGRTKVNTAVVQAERKARNPVSPAVVTNPKNPKNPTNPTDLVNPRTPRTVKAVNPATVLPKDHTTDRTTTNATNTTTDRMTNRTAVHTTDHSMTPTTVKPATVKSDPVKPNPVKPNPVTPNPVKSVKPVQPPTTVTDRTPRTTVTTTARNGGSVTPARTTTNNANGHTDRGNSISRGERIERTPTVAAPKEADHRTAANVKPTVNPIMNSTAKSPVKPAVNPAVKPTMANPARTPVTHAEPMPRTNTASPSVRPEHKDRDVTPAPATVAAKPEHRESRPVARPVAQPAVKPVAKPTVKPADPKPHAPVATAERPARPTSPAASPIHPAAPAHPATTPARSDRTDRAASAPRGADKDSSLKQAADPKDARTSR